jgi:hypothetical protein
MTFELCLRRTFVKFCFSIKKRERKKERKKGGKKERKRKVNFVHIHLSVVEIV